VTTLFYQKTANLSFFIIHFSICATYCTLSFPLLYYIASSGNHDGLFTSIKEEVKDTSSVNLTSFHVTYQNIMLS